MFSLSLEEITQFHVVWSEDINSKLQHRKSHTNLTFKTNIMPNQSVILCISSTMSCYHCYLYLIIGRVLTDRLTAWPVLLSTVCSQHPVPTHPSPQQSTPIRWRAPLGRRVSGDGMLIQTYMHPIWSYRCSRIMHHSSLKHSIADEITLIKHMKLRVTFSHPM